MRGRAMTPTMDSLDSDEQAPRFGPRALAAAAVGLAVLVALVNLPLLTGEAYPIWDADSAYAPWQMMVGDAARALRLLLWNPWSNAGSPDGFEPDFGALSPVHLLVGLAFGGGLASYYALWLGTWWLAGVGMLVLCRWLGASVVGASLAALAFAFSGFLLCHSQHMSFLFTYAAMPFVVWRLDVALCGVRWRPVAESAALFGLGSLGGYPGVSVVSALVVGLWAVGRVGWMGPDGRAGQPVRRPTTPGWLVGAAALWGVVALTVAAPTTLGLAYEARGFSDRSEPISREMAAGSNPMLPVALFSSVGPYVAQVKAANRALWPETDTSSMSFYLGAVALWLAVCGLVLGRRRGLHAWLFAIGLLSLGIGLGTTLPLRGWLYDLFPPARYFRHASSFRAWFELTIAISAALGWREMAAWWHERPTRGWRRVAPVAIAGAGALAAASQLLLARGLDVEVPHASWVLAHGVLVWTGVLILAATLCYGPRGTSMLPRTAWALLTLAALDLSATAWLQAPLRMDRREEAAESWRVVAAGQRAGFDLVALGTPREFASPLFPNNTNKGMPQRIPTLRNYSPLANRFQQRMVRNLQEIPWAIGEDRFWFVPRAGAGFVALSDATYDATIARFQATSRRFIPLHLPSDVLDPAPEGEAGPREAADAVTLARMASARRIAHRILAYEPEHLLLEVTAPAAGYVVVTDRWARGWKAFVDGEAVQLFGASFVYRAVAVPPGTHRIDMRYEPRSHPLLLSASWGTLTLVGVWSLSAVRASRRRRG